MNRMFAYALLAAVAGAVLTDSASAQILGRRWERRRAELYGSLNASLSARVDVNVAQQAAVLEERLSETNQAQIAAEADKLKGQVESELAALRQQAAEAVAAEAKRLAEETETKVAALRDAAQQQMAAEMKKLQDDVKAEFARLREDATQFVAAEVKKSQEALARQVAAQTQKANDAVMPALKDAIAAEVKAALQTSAPADDQQESTPVEQPADRPAPQSLAPQSGKDEDGDGT